MLTIAFVMLGEVLIFLPSIANFRVQWLKTRVAQAEIAALVTDAAPDAKVDATLRDTLLMEAGVEAVAVMREGRRSLVLRSETQMTVDETFDLRGGNTYTSIGPALMVMLQNHDRLINVIDKPPGMSGNSIEIAIHEWPLRDSMLNFGFRVLALSVGLSLLVAGLIFTALNGVLVQPMKRLSTNMMLFAQAPEDVTRIIQPSLRSDEIGLAEHELQDMQKQLQGLLHQKNHLAALGLAMSKVSHDLRNMLTSAQLISDRLGDVKDQRVQRFAPKLIASLDRAINFLNQTLKYGRAQELPPQREMMMMRKVAEEVLETMRLQSGRITLNAAIPANLMVDADREQLSRMLTNLTRNAIQAIETRPQTQDEVLISALREGNLVRVRVADTGPGIPPSLAGKMFKAFQSSARQGGTGLGLAISAELAQAHGGGICVATTSESGTVFEISLPDRTEH